MTCASSLPPTPMRFHERAESYDAHAAPQKRFAEEQCRHPWLLNLDADEVTPEDLAAEIAALFAKGEPA